MRGQKNFTWRKRAKQMEPLPLPAAAAAAASRVPPLPSICSSLLPSLPHSPPRFLLKNQSFRVQCSSLPVITASGEDDDGVAGRPKSDDQYKPGFLDDLFLTLFRNKMAKEVGWDSEKPGYDGLIDVAKRLMLTGRTNSDTRDAAVRILRSLFPPLLLDLYKMLVSPLAGGEVAALMVARVTALTCQWLMGKCTVNSVELTDGSSWESGVFVERCKYLEESKCVGICINTCKLPTQAFFKDYMGIPLLMEPNFSDYSCQFKFGIVPPLPEDDGALNEPCLEACPVASRRKEMSKEIVNIDVATKCPKA